MDEALLAPQAIDLPLTWRYSRFVSGRLSRRINCRLPAATPEEEELKHEEMGPLTIALAVICSS